jgi:cell division septation protein DedD
MARLRWAGLAASLAAALAAPAAGPAAGQAASLDRAEELVAGAAYDQARALLAQWWDSREATNAPGSERARALMLRARLAPDPVAAEADYLAIVLGYPVSSHAPQALLRLGQGLLAAGQPDRAVGYLRRLVADYPGRPERTVGLLWLARASAAERQFAAACDATRQGLRDAGDPVLAALLRAEESTVCAAAGAANVAAAPTSPRQPELAARAAAESPVAAPGADPPAAGPAGGTGRFTVQAGAFRHQPGVDDLAGRLRRAGHQPRVVLVPANDLVRVRVGRFPTHEEAARLLARLRGQGFDAIVVADADRERLP